MGTFLRLAGYVFSGLRFRLLLLVAVACAPLVALTLHTAWEDRRRAIVNLRQKTERLVQIASREEEKIVGGSRGFLLSMSDSEAIRDGDQARCKATLTSLGSIHKEYANLFVATTNGEILASAKPTGPRLTPSEAELCRRTVETGAFAAGDFPSGQSRGHPMVNFAYPVFDASGHPKGAVLAAVDLADWYSGFGSVLSDLAFQFPRGATWTELDRKGTILLRYPSPRTWIGYAYPEQPAFKAFWEKRAGVTQGENSIGVPTFYAFSEMPSQLSGGDTVGVLSVPKQTLFAASDRTLFTNLAWLSLAAALAVGLGWIGSDLLIIRPVKALVESSARLASGDLSVRTGLRHGHDELGRLMLAFDQMARALEFRDQERRRASQKLQVMSQRLVEVQESERRHLARELHDEIGQSLTVAEMNLQAALQSTKQLGVTRRLQDSIEAVERVAGQVHDLSLNLRPSMLDDLGLEPAVRWYTNRQANAAGIHARFRADQLENRLEPLIETECFRVAQEALTNVVKHSKARNVAVSLDRIDGQLHLSVKDDGIGFDVNSLRDQAVQGASLGLLSMEERATLAGGGLEFLSSPGNGTEVHAWFPVKWRKVEIQS